MSLKPSFFQAEETPAWKKEGFREENWKKEGFMSSLHRRLYLGFVSLLCDPPLDSLQPVHVLLMLEAPELDTALYIPGKPSKLFSSLWIFN